MTEHPARHARVLLTGLAALALTTTAACDSGTPGAASTATDTSTSSGSSSPSSSSSSPSSSTSGSTTTTAAPTCGEQLAAAMTPAQRAGQLLMVGLQPTGSSRALAAQVKKQDLGGVIYLGGWSDGASVHGDHLGPAARARPPTGCSSPPTRRVARCSSCAGRGSPGCRPRAPRPQSGVATEEKNVETWSRELEEGRRQHQPRPGRPTPCPPRSGPRTSPSAGTAATSPPARPRPMLRMPRRSSAGPSPPASPRPSSTSPASAGSPATPTSPAPASPTGRLTPTTPTSRRSPPGSRRAHLS